MKNEFKMLIDYVTEETPKYIESIKKQMSINPLVEKNVNARFGDYFDNEEVIREILFGYLLFRDYGKVVTEAYFESYTMHSKEIFVQYNPLILMHNNGAGLGLLDISDDDSVFIIADNIYVNMPNEYKLALIGHEVGHKINKHKAITTDINIKNNIFSIYNSENDEYLEQEYEADRYSISLGYNMHDALLYIANILMEINGSIDKSVEKRLIEMEKLSI